MKVDAAIANASWFAASLPEWARYKRAASNVKDTQCQLLSRYLARNATTDFGQEHDFGRIKGPKEYAERVPIRTYDDFRPWIERIADGEQAVLTAEPVDLLEPSSGSSGAEKWVPYTKTLQAEFRRAVAAWITQNFMNDPALMGGRAYWCLTPNIPRDREAKTSVPIGFDEDSAYLGGFAQRLVDLTLATSPALKNIHDMDRFWHVTLLLLLQCRDLRLISVWHPSFVLLMLKHLRRKWDNLLADMRFGLTLSEPSLQIGADRARARELDVIGADDPAAIWPHLRLISCWGDANAAGGLGDLQSSLPTVEIQPKGLVATEAFITLPFSDNRPLAIRSHYFEFLDDRGDVLPAWSLRPGHEYSLVVTTGGGLYRYRIQDRVEVAGNFRGIPGLRFVGKEDNVSDFFGEKLSETFVAESLKVVFDRHGLSPRFAMLALDDSAEPPAYALYLQCPNELPSDVEAELETELRRNPHYELCTRLGQLAPARVVSIEGNAYEVYTSVLTERGMRLGDIKPAPLSRFTDWSIQFFKPGRS